jgi:ribosomal protein S8
MELTSIKLFHNDFLKKKLISKQKRSNFSIRLANCLYAEGFIFAFTIDTKNINMYLKHSRGKFIINSIKIFSTPSKICNISFYVLESLITKNPTIIYVLSTNIGIITNKLILKKKLGGILLFSIF